MKKKLLALLVVLAMVLAMVPAVNAQSSFFLKVTPSVSTANVGDTIEYTVYATGEGVTALQFNLEIPEGMTFVSDSGAVPSGLKSYLGWAATDWTEKVVDKESGLVTDYPMIWTGYNDLPSNFGEDTVIMTFSCTVDAAGEYEIGVFELLPFDEDYEEFPAELSVGKVTVAGAAEPAGPSMDVTVKASATTVDVGDTIDYTVYGTGAGVTALQFNLEIPEGLTFVTDSGVVPSGLKSYLGWAATDWTEKVVDKDTGLVTDYPMIWTGYNDLPSVFGEGTILMTFSCTADAAGTYEIGVDELLPFDENYEEFPATLSVDAVTVIAPEPECEHSFTNYVSNGDATCTEDGTKTAECDKGCGETDTVADTGSATGHSYTNYVAQNDATCTEDGTKVASCDNGCGATDTKTDAGTAKGHKFTNYVPAGDSTCLGAGTEIAECDNGCGATDVKPGEGEGLGHSFTNYVSDGNATCTENGTETAVCDRCDATDTREDADSALGHSFTNYVADGNATCTENGTETAVCDRCDETDTREDADSATGHDLKKVDATVTCTEAGTIAYYVCQNCGLMFADATASIPVTEDDIQADALGHIDQDGNNACDRCGLVEGCFMNITVKASKTDVKVGDTVDYTIYAYGNDVTALQFNLVIPEGLSFVSGSGAVPEGLKSYLGWAATDWTEKVEDEETGEITYPMIWTGYNDLGSLFEDGTVIMTFSCVAEAEGTYEIGFYDLLPFDLDYEEFEAGLSVEAVTVSEEEEPTTEPTEPSEEPTEPSEEPTEPSEEPTEPTTKPSETTKPDADKEEIPKTDNNGMMIYFAVMMAAAFAVLFTVLMGKKKYEA